MSLGAPTGTLLLATQEHRIFCSQWLPFKGTFRLELITVRGVALISGLSYWPPLIVGCFFLARLGFPS